MNIVYLVFGTKTTYHLQTYFSILTVLRHKRKTDTITVYTDNPQYYRRLKAVNVSTFSKKTLDEWINGTDYIFRAKIKAIEESAKRKPDANLLFLDGDTVLLNDELAEIEETLNSGKGIMYTNEGHPSKMRGKALRMWNAVKGKTVDGCTLSMKHNMWNSGVIGIPMAKKGAVISLALDVCDMFCRKT